MADRRTMSRMASAASLSFTVTRTMSQPASAACSICRTVASMSDVFVFVIVWTDTGAPPPTLTSPMDTWRVNRRTPTLYVGCGEDDPAMMSFVVLRTGISMIRRWCQHMQDCHSIDLLAGLVEDTL